MYLAPSIGYICNHEVIYLICMWDDTRHSLYFGVPWVDDGQNRKNGRGSSQETQNMGKLGITVTAPLGATRGSHFCSPLPWIILRNRLTSPLLNTTIIPWCLLIKSGSYFWFKSLMHSFFQSCAFVNKIILPCQNT